MAQKSISGNSKLAERIRARRNELHLTIEEAAKRAGLGTKTWCRYEAGESIRQDKCKGVCKALNWVKLPNEDKEENVIDLENECKHEAWSKYLEDKFGKIAALSFSIGSDILLDYVNQDLEELSKQPKGGHEIIAHSVLEEIILILVEEESEFLIESYENLELESDWKEWVYDVLGDADIDMFLYSDEYLSADDSYHFSHWLEQHFHYEEE